VGGPVLAETSDVRMQGGPVLAETGDARTPSRFGEQSRLRIAARCRSTLRTNSAIDVLGENGGS
jgi:hypothetical protein